MYSAEDLLRREPCKTCELSLVCTGIGAYPIDHSVCRLCGRRLLKLRAGTKDGNGLWSDNQSVYITVEVSVDNALQAPCLSGLPLREIAKCHECQRRGK